MKPTIEQTTLNIEFKLGNDIKVEALAGTGKSSSLRYLATENSARTFLALCFNAANAEESNSNPNKPNNIFYSTIHSLAYAVIMKDRMMKAKLSRWLDYNDIPENEIYNLTHYINSLDNSFKKKVTASKLVIQLVQKFCQSGLELSQLGELFNTEFNDDLILKGIQDIGAFQNDVITVVSSYWNRLNDPGYPDKITHDVYLKIFQLRKYKIESFWSNKHKCYIQPNVLCLDEAQDTNGVAEAIFENQDHLQRILVGDNNQQIYAWRGAGNTLDKYSNFKTCYLTETFRSCQNIVDKANKVLSLGSDLKMITNVQVKEVKSRAYLSRTNASSLKFALKCMEHEDKFSFNLDFDDIFSKLWHISAVMWDKTPAHPDKDLVRITGAKELQQATGINDEIALYVQLLPKITQLYGNLTAAKKVLSESAKVTDEDAVVISTIHKSKGLEWDEVVISDDFFGEFVNDKAEDLTKEQVLNKIKESEWRCLLYVAITRAKYEVTVPHYLDFLFREC